MVALALVGVFLDSGVGLFAFIRKAGDKEVVEKKPPTEPGMINVTLSDGTSLSVRSDVLALNENLDIRKDARQVVAPLRREGIAL